MAKTNARRVAALGVLWRAFTQGRRPGAPGIGELAGAVPRMVGGTVSGRYRMLGKAPSA